MRGVNKVILVGNLGADPEVKYTPQGGAVARISVATTDSWKNKDSGERHERTEWHRVVFFNRLAEIVGEYLQKGSQVYIEGSLQTRKWQNRDGQDVYTTEIRASDMQMMGASGGRSGDNAPSQGNRQSSGGNSPPAPPPAPPASMPDDFDDDIPF